MLAHAEPAPPRSRTITGDLEVQIHLDDDGRWHRQAIGGEYSGCGKPVDHRNRHAHRLEVYDTCLCIDGCFTAFELEQGRRNQERDDR